MKTLETVFSLISHILQVLPTAAGQFVGWSSSFVDYDNDGIMDIYKTNGALKHLYGHEDQLFENIGDGKFKDVSTRTGQILS